MVGRTAQAIPRLPGAVLGPASIDYFETSTELYDGLKIYNDRRELLGAKKRLFKGADDSPGYSIGQTVFVNNSADPYLMQRRWVYSILF